MIYGGLFMSCPNCTIAGQQITFRLPPAIINVIEAHFHHTEQVFTVTDNEITTNEKGARDLNDFLTEMALTENVIFRINKFDWLDIHQFNDYRDAAWIDGLISERFLKMHFQPIIKQNGTIFAYEMLARFVDQSGTMIYPDVMFPAASRRGRTFALDRICRIHAVKQVKRLKTHQKAFINFIPTAIYTPEFCLKTTTKVAKMLDIDSSRFVFEVVETEKVKDTDHLKSILNYYLSHGFEFALDDVGAGYNTLDFLATLEPPYIKLDRDYVDGVATDFEKQRIADEVLKIAKQFKATTLAEGVESFEDFEWLKARGFELFQGYLFGKAEPDPLAIDVIDLNTLKG